MTKDPRPLIIARMRAILGELVLEPTPGGSTPASINVYRNREQVPVLQTPFAMLLDGSETRPVTPPVRGRQRPGLAPYIMSMTPQVWYVARERDLQSQKESTNLGDELTAMRRIIGGAMLKDPALLGMLGSNGRIDYAGMTSDLENGRTLEGSIQVNFDIRYVLHF